MYEGRIVAEAVVATPADARFVTANDDSTGSALVGFLVLLVGLPLLALQVLGYVLMRNTRRLVGLARLVGAAYADARQG